MSDEGLRQAQQKMADGGVHKRAIDVFAHYYRELESGATGIIAEADVEPLLDPPTLDELEVDDATVTEAFRATAMVKLNGGLGTSMGMDRAKSLLEVREGQSFLDVIARQVLAARSAHDAPLPLLFMNSFRTRDDTLSALEGYDLEVNGLPLDFVQNREPKLVADDLTPVSWPKDPDLEWCPPGHGDLYTALEVSGVLDGLLDAGFRYATVSNSDNLGAAPDPRIAGWFAASGAPYAAEVCTRTMADRKGGHLVVRKSDGQLILRDTAQVREEDMEAYADIDKHPFFHTNNLWFDLQAVADTLAAREGVLGLPLIRNLKTVDPADSSSPEVVQIETAMGAAVEVFEGARAIAVPRSRFLPVKTTNDLLVIRSDVYDLGDDGRLAARADAPAVDLDSSFFKLVGDFDRRFPHGAPSLVEAESLTVRGDWTFGSGVRAVGRAEVDEEGSPGEIADGTTLGSAG